jgi:hypothetical protein
MGDAQHHQNRSKIIKTLFMITWETHGENTMLINR